MSRASGPKGVRARLTASFQLPASGRRRLVNWGGAAGWESWRVAPHGGGAMARNDGNRLGRHLLWTSIISSGLLLAACGGGGGVSSPGTVSPAPTPSPTPSPSPTPAPTPTPTSSASSTEYQASGAVVLAKASYAYDKGIDGKGVTIAVIDSGINTTTPEFAGRISPDSTGFAQVVARCGTCAPETVQPYPIDDHVGHGTEVASVAAAAMNGSGIQGVAPGVTILALKIVAPDLSGQTTSSTGPIPESSGVNSNLIAPAINYAVAHGAFVITMSINGVSSGQAAADQRAAMDQVRAQDRLVVESVSNDTGQDSFTGQFAQNLVGADLTNKDWFLFAIGLDQNGLPRVANGNAGPLADRMIAAAGNNIQALDQDGNLTTVTGNSYAAPAVAAAAALLKQYWPNLGGKAIARILLDTADDAGPVGVDQTYGVGILDVTRAMQAQASQAAFSSAAAVLTRYASVTMSAPFGGAAGAAALDRAVASMTVYDRYGRDYRLAGNGGVRARSSGLVASAMLPIAQPLWVHSPSFADTRLGLAEQDPSGPWQGVTSGQPAIASFSPAPGQMMTVGANVGVTSSTGLAGSPLRGLGLQPVGMTAQWQGHGWSAGFSSGASRNATLRLNTASLATPLGLGIEVSQLHEQGQVLGLGGVPGGGTTAADSTLVTLTGQRRLAGVALSARATVGMTRADGAAALFGFTSPILSSAFSLEGSHGFLGGLASLGIASPLRVERASAAVMVPVAYDLVTGALTQERRTLDLAPSARELDLSLGWAAALSRTTALKLGVARAFDAGHVAGAADTAGFLTLSIR